MIARFLSVCLVALADNPPQNAPTPEVAARRRVAVVGVELDPQARQASVQAAKVAEVAALRNPQLEVKDVAVTFDEANERVRAERFSMAQNAVARGRNHYDNLELEDAVDDFDRAAAMLEKSNLTEHFRDWVRAVQFRVAARFLAGDAGTARADLAKLAVVEPRLDFDKSLFPAEILNAAKQVKVPFPCGRAR